MAKPFQPREPSTPWWTFLPGHVGAAVIQSIWLCAGELRRLLLLLLTSCHNNSFPATTEERAGWDCLDPGCWLPHHRAGLSQTAVHKRLYILWVPFLRSTSSNLALGQDRVCWRLCIGNPWQACFRQAVQIIYFSGLSGRMGLKWGWSLWEQLLTQDFQPSASSQAGSPMGKTSL